MAESLDTHDSSSARAALITGGTGKLGRRLADAFVAAGWRVAVCGPDRDALDALVSKLGRDGDRNRDVLAVPCDVRDEGEVVRMVHRVVQHFGRIDTLVNAASIVGPRVPLMDFPAGSWREVLATNLTGTFLTCREALPWMVRQGGGSVINVTSAIAKSMRPGWGAFLASKCAVEGLTRMLAEEVRASGVRVNLVDFGTPRADGRTPRTADDWAAPFLWLADGASSGTTGQRIRVSAFRRNNQADTGTAAEPIENPMPDFAGPADIPPPPC